MASVVAGQISSLCGSSSRGSFVVGVPHVGCVEK